MRKTLLILTLLVQLFFASGDLWSQSKYPIYVTPTLLPPYSLNLSDYSAYGSQKLMVTIVVNDLEIANLPVKLRIKMETAGVTIENPPTLNTTPLFLDGGSANVLFGEDFVDYFNINNLQFKGYSKEAYRRSGQLPEGFYKFTVEVLHFHTNRVISNAGTVTAWIALGKPPLLRMPANDVQLGQYNGIPITFSWLASNVGSPISAGSIRYKFEMWEVRVKGVNPYNVVASMPVFHEYVTSSTSYSFNPASVMMEEGLTYAWRVTAFDESGLVPFEQNGQSEVRTFNYKSLCEEVQDITTTSSGQKGGFTWMPDKNHTSYNVEIKNAATGWFSANETFDSKVEFYELERGHTYELRVQAVCNSDPNSTSDYSQWKALTIAEAENKENNEDCPDCGCSDDMPNVELTNFELRKDLAPGDIISNKTGTTRFIVKKVEPQGDGIYKGVFYFWAEIWGLKIPCDFWDLQVNTDNVVVNMDYKSINDPKFLLDVDVLVDNANTFLDQAAVLTSDGTIADTLKVAEHFDHIIVKDGQLVAVVISDDGKPIETPLNITAEEAKKKMITNDKGDALVINSKGEAMGAKEFQETGGGNTRLMNNYNKEKESKDLSASTLVTFSGHPAQKYGFDSYTEVKTNIQNNYPVLKNDHRPAFKSVASMGYDKVGVSAVEGIKFRDEMGIPSATVDGGISVTGAHNGSVKALYAYRENEDKTEEIVGKLNVVSFDNEPKRVHIIPVNDEITFSPTELQTTLNTIYGQAVATWIVEPEEKITLDFPNGIMTHEGSGTFSTYNKDQNAIANAYEASGRKFVSGDLYLFFIKEATFKDRSLAGFMPLQRQIGFIYGKPSLEIIAHELGHGSFNLRHTFSPEAFIVGEGKTQNLMDYKDGTELWKYQWDLIHDPEKILFSWAQDESEGAAIIAESMTVQAIVDSLKYHYENSQTDTLRITQWENKNNIKEKVSIALSDGNHVEFDVEVMWVSYDGTDITDTTEFVPFRHTQDFIKFKLTDYSLFIKDEQGNLLHLETYFKDDMMNLVEYIGITRTMLGLECKDNDGNVDIACTILNLIKDGIAQEDTIFTLPYQYCSSGSHSTRITHNDRTFSVSVVSGLCTSSSNRKFSLQEKDKRTIGSKEVFVFMRSDVYSLDGATTVRVEKEYVDDLESYLFDSYILDDGTIIGDPVKDCRLVPSGTHGLHGGRFGCTRTWGSTCNDNEEYYSYLTARGPGIGLGTTFHSGVDIYAADGTPLHSILQGTVVDIDNVDDNDLGKSITIKSTTNVGIVYLMYCHLSEIVEVKVGDEVKKGDDIGKTGITGNASTIAVSRRHVHIEASTDGVFWGGTTRIDPEQFITTKFDVNGNPIKIK